MEKQTQTKQCLYCAKYFEDDEPDGNALGICPECKIEPTYGCTCNRCGAEISLQEYDSNIDGYCEECQDDVFYEECLYHEEDWEDYWEREYGYEEE